MYHTAGKAGRGGASYIDSVILRDRNSTGGWTGSAGSTLDERRFYLQNWRADVIAVIKDDGDPVEYVRYSSYGEPFVYPVADINRDGVVSATDSDDFYDLFTEGNSSWNRSAVSFDLNRNGTSFDDDTLFNESYSANSGKSGAGRLSHDSVLNRKGYAGYEWDPVVGVFHVRNRVYLPQIGRWSRRDTIGYVAGTNLYQYVLSQALRSTDPTGLQDANPTPPFDLNKPYPRVPIPPDDPPFEDIFPVDEPNSIPGDFWKWALPALLPDGGDRLKEARLSYTRPEYTYRIVFGPDGTPRYELESDKYRQLFGWQPFDRLIKTESEWYSESGVMQFDPERRIRYGVDIQFDGEEENSIDVFGFTVSPQLKLKIGGSQGRYSFEAFVTCDALDPDDGIQDWGFKFEWKLGPSF